MIMSGSWMLIKLFAENFACWWWCIMQYLVMQEDTLDDVDIFNDWWKFYSRPSDLSFFWIAYFMVGCLKFCFEVMQYLCHNWSWILLDKFPGLVRILFPHLFFLSLFMLMRIRPLILTRELIVISLIFHLLLCHAVLQICRWLGQ